MVNNKFEAYKIEREVKRSGTPFTLLRFGTNAFGEPSDEVQEVGTFRGLYHEQNSTVSITTGETTQTRTKKVPSILCLQNAIADFNIGVGDMVSNGTSKVFRVTGLVDIQEWHTIIDISLELVDDGK